MAYDYKKAFSVEGKRCIVTGGAQGLSRGMAEGLLENGAEVVLMDLQEEKLKEVVKQYNEMGYKAHAVAGNLSKKEEVDRMFDEAMKILGGKLDVLIPAAGIQRRYEPWEFPEEMWNLVIDVNLNHVWFMCQKAIQVMKDQDTVGKIINIGSMSSFFGGTTVPAYTAAVYLLNGEQEGVNHGNQLEQAPVKAHMVHEHLMSVMNAVSIFDEYGHHENKSERINRIVSGIL